MSSQQPSFSYIIVTYNKFPYFQDAIAKLLAVKKDDEEIVVVDGGSTDGTVEYLQELLDKGDVDQFVSGKDNGLAHAINKGLLMAKGQILKTMSDDDIYYYEEMQKCKDFMLAHPEIDALGTNGITHDGKEYHREEDFLLRKKGYHPFMIVEQGLMLRKSSIPLFGLADTSFTTFWDSEFTIRLTAGKSRLAWYTGIAWKHVLNPSSLSLSQAAVWRAHAARLRRMYPIYSPWRHYVPKPIREFIRFFVPKKRLATVEQSSTPTFLV